MEKKRTEQMSIVKGREKGTKFATGNLEASSPRETGVEQGPKSKYDTMGKLIMHVDSDCGYRNFLHF